MEDTPYLFLFMFVCLLICYTDFKTHIKFDEMKFQLKTTFKGKSSISYHYFWIEAVLNGIFSRGTSIITKIK